MPRVTSQTNKPKKRTTSPRKKKVGVLGRISNVDTENTGIKISLYGRSGTGKTVLWSSFPGPILVLLCSGTSNPGELKSISAANKKKISKVVVENVEEMQELISYQQEEQQFKTIVLDHATGYQDLILKNILELDELPAQKSWGMASQQDYQICTQQTKEAFRGLLGLDCNVVIIAQEREFNMGEDHDDLLVPHISSALTPSAAGFLNSSCDYICNTFIRQKSITKKMKISGKMVEKSVVTDDVEYCLRTGPNPVYQTKFRMPIEEGRKLPKVLVDPTYQKIAKLIK